MNQESPPYYQALHDEAVRQGQHWYIDPRSGYLVMTALYLKEKGSCCQSGCRHCPYGFKKPVG